MQKETELILKHSVDEYNGVHIKDAQLDFMDELNFGRYLQSSLNRWDRDERNGVWLKVPPKKSHFLPIAVELGFTFHHCDEKIVILTKWLPITPNRLPAAPSHFVGVGGFVVNTNREVLVVREKNGPITKIWKLPGGSVDPKEDLHKAAIREVFEETGIKTEFVGILSARQSHVARFGKSDLYVTCLLKPLTNQITIQEEEIEAAKWMPLDALFELEYYKGTHLYQKILEIGRDAHDGKVPIWEGTELPLRFAKGSNILYHGSKAKL